MDNVQLPHYNYVGDSVIGNFAHLGAGAIISNLKSTKTEVYIGKEIPTGLRKAGAFIGEHSFSTVLGAGRPDAKDMAVVEELGVKAAEAVVKAEAEGIPAPIEVEGVPKPYRGYYQPRDRKGNPIDIRKVKPLTNDNCINCGLCAKVCPMGAIDPADVKSVPGICIKCCACEKKCPVQAKYYEDPGYLYHKVELEEGYTRRAEPVLFTR